MYVLWFVKYCTYVKWIMEYILNIQYFRPLGRLYNLLVVPWSWCDASIHTLFCINLTKFNQKNFILHCIFCCITVEWKGRLNEIENFPKASNWYSICCPHSILIWLRKYILLMPTENLFVYLYFKLNIFVTTWYDTWMQYSPFSWQLKNKMYLSTNKNMSSICYCVIKSESLWSTELQQLSNLQETISI